jgi:hypothetical protein
MPKKYTMNLDDALKEHRDLLPVIKASSHPRSSEEYKEQLKEYNHMKKMKMHYEPKGAKEEGKKHEAAETKKMEREEHMKKMSKKLKGKK